MKEETPIKRQKEIRAGKEKSVERVSKKKRKKKKERTRKKKDKRKTRMD